MDSNFTYNFNFIIDLLMILIFSYFLYKKYENFKDIPKLKGLDLPLKTLYLGFLIHLSIIFMIIVEFIVKFIMKAALPVEMDLILIIFFLLLVYYIFSGRKPLIEENRFKVDIKFGLYNFTRGAGYDLFSSCVGSYDGGIIAYNYLIDKDTIKIIENSKDKIVITGLTKTKKYGKLPITVTFNSRPSVKYMTKYIENNYLKEANI